MPTEFRGLVLHKPYELNSNFDILGVSVFVCLYFRILTGQSVTLFSHIICTMTGGVIICRSVLFQVVLQTA